jgi:glycosyltransferase involved in cell wall biosynthesis
MTPIVSFVVPCYKLGHLLRECVDSILCQTYSDFEVLIMDDCSPDNTPEVAQSFQDPRVKYIRNDPVLSVRTAKRSLDAKSICEVVPACAREVGKLLTQHPSIVSMIFDNKFRIVPAVHGVRQADPDRLFPAFAIVAGAPARFARWRDGYQPEKKHEL